MALKFQVVGFKDEDARRRGCVRRAWSIGAGGLANTVDTEAPRSKLDLPPNGGPKMLRDFMAERTRRKDIRSGKYKEETDRRTVRALTFPFQQQELPAAPPEDSVRKFPPERPSLPPWPRAVGDTATNYNWLGAWNSDLSEGPVVVDQASVSLQGMYRGGTVWLSDALSETVTDRSLHAIAWRELQLELSCTTPCDEGGRLTGCITVALAHALPTQATVASSSLEESFRCSSTQAASSSGAEAACGISLNLLSKSLTVWTSTEEGSVKHVDADVRNGDRLRVLVSQQGWCDVLGSLASAEDNEEADRWSVITGWQTPFDERPLFVAVGLRHTVVAKLCRVYRPPADVAGAANSGCPSSTER